MGDRTNIEWTDATWNPIRARRWDYSDGEGFERIGWHCEHVSEGCRNCYAERMNLRLGTQQEFKPAHLVHVTPLGDRRGDVELFLDGDMLLQPLRWKRPRRIFVNSMTDTFADFVQDEWLDALFAVMALTPWHTYQVLTKRPARMLNAMTHKDGFGRWGFIDARARKILREFNGMTIPPGKVLLGPLPHVWLGISAEDQKTFDDRVHNLVGTPAAIRFLSLEPMLGPIVIPPDLLTPIEGTSQHGQRFIDWVICGGESGPHARPMHPQWARDLRDQCSSAGVPFHFKQWGEWVPRSDCYHRFEDGSSCADMDPGATRWPCVRLTYEGRNGRLLRNASVGDDAYVQRIGKKAAGRLLDGVQHDGFPATQEPTR